MSILTLQSESKLARENLFGPHHSRT